MKKIEELNKKKRNYTYSNNADVEKNFFVWFSINSDNEKTDI